MNVIIYEAITLMSNYPFHEIEVKWQKYWEDHKRTT
jgi:leucyl-tRNA synthetase